MRRIGVLAVFLFAAAGVSATIFGNVRGIVHDPQHRPVQDVTVILKAIHSEFTERTQTNAEGVSILRPFRWANIPFPFPM